MTMRVLVIGAGAVGGWLAGALASGGAEVALLARGATLQALRERGLAPDRGRAEEVFVLPASDRAEDLPRPDAVILAVKTHAFAEAVAWGAPAFSEGPGGPLVVTAMNGLPWWFLDGLAGPSRGPAPGERRSRRRGRGPARRARPVGAVVHASMRAERPGAVRVAAVDRLILGEPGGIASREAQELAALRRGRRRRLRRDARHPARDLGQAVGQHEHEPGQRPDAAQRPTGSSASRGSSSWCAT